MYTYRLSQYKYVIQYTICVAGKFEFSLDVMGIMGIFCRCVCCNIVYKYMEMDILTNLDSAGR